MRQGSVQSLDDCSGSARSERVIGLAGLVLCLALWPLLAVHAAYGLSIWQDYAPACNPYWDGCTSISRAGRHGWANHLFRATLLPYSLLLGLFWWLAQGWLRVSGDRGSRAMAVSGTLGALFMVLYVTFLGTEGEVYQLMRRYGIYVYFGGTYMAQVLLTGRLRVLTRHPDRAWPAGLVTVQLGLCLAMLGMGLVTVAAYGLPVDRDRWQNALEWSAALCLQLYFLTVALAWRYSRLRLALGCDRFDRSR